MKTVVLTVSLMIPYTRQAREIADICRHYHIGHLTPIKADFIVDFVWQFRSALILAKQACVKNEHVAVY